MENENTQVENNENQKVYCKSCGCDITEIAKFCEDNLCPDCEGIDYSNDEE